MNNLVCVYNKSFTLSNCFHYFMAHFLCKPFIQNYCNYHLGIDNSRGWPLAHLYHCRIFCTKIDTIRIEKIKLQENCTHSGLIMCFNWQHFSCPFMIARNVSVLHISHTDIVKWVLKDCPWVVCMDFITPRHILILLHLKFYDASGYNNFHTSYTESHRIDR